MLRMGILEPVEALAKIGLDPKAKRDGETERYCLLLMANIAVSSENHQELIKSSLDTLIGFSKSSDIQCRQFSMFALFVSLRCFLDVSLVSPVNMTRMATTAQGSVFYS